MINHDYLDALYRWKVEAEIELEKLEEENKFEISAEDEKCTIRIKDLKIKNAEGIVNRYKTAIKSYLFHHVN